jgi:MFS family permease
LGFAWLLDSLEANVIGSVLGILKKLWHFTPVQGSLTVSSWLVGIMVGAVFFGYLADRYGRKKMFILTLLWYGSFTLVAAFSQNIWFFIIVRFFAAVGIGGEYVAIGSAVVEFIPRLSRGKVDAFLQSFWPLGAALSGLLVLIMLRVFPPEIAWRSAFLFAVVLTAFAMIIRRYVPESPRWLLERGRVAEARVIVEQAEKEVMRQHGLSTLPSVTPIAIEQEQRSVWDRTKELWQTYPWRMIMGASLNFSQVAFGYGSMAYAALVLFPETKTPPNTVPFYVMVSFLFATLGGLTTTFMLDKFGRKATVVISYASYPFAAMSMIFVHTSLGAFASLCLMQYCYQWAAIAERIINSEIFPTRSRAAGLGWVICLGRLGGVIAPPVLTAVFEIRRSIVDVSCVLVVLTICGFISACFWAWKGVEGRHRSLEEMEIAR